MALFRRSKKFKILFVTAEEAPFAKVGGLGEVMFSLPRALTSLGHDARVMIPLYASIDKSAAPLPYVYEQLGIPTAPESGGELLYCNVRKFEAPADGRGPVTTYFLENQEYYELRANVYGYADDRVRFALLSRACLEFLNAWGEWTPDIIVAADWMTGYLPNFLKTDYKEYRRLEAIATVFSIHNLGSQGTIRNHNFLQESERDDGYGPIPDFLGDRMQFINAMRRGILHADVINTVSATYANEITTEEFGEGLDALLRERRGRLFGVLNGMDYEANDPSTDTRLARNFAARSLEARGENKLALQQRFGLPQGARTFVMGIVSRLTRQKGFSLLEPIIEPFLRATKAQLIVLGTGETEIMDFFQKLEQKFPQQVRAHLQFDADLPHLIYAGADSLLIPSKFEPSGLTQMEAMRFGAIPVARRTGGLADTIEDCAPEEGKGTGFLFDEFDSAALLIAMTRAFVSWRYIPAWRRMQKRAMEEDFSWDRSAREYEKLFARAIRIHKENGNGNGPAK